MAQRRPPHRSSPSSAIKTSPSSLSHASKGPPQPIPQSRRWLYRFLLLTLVPLLFFATLELGLRLFGFGYSTSFFIRAEDPNFLIPNPYFGWQFFSRQTATYPFPCRIPARKAPGTVRIFVLGESAAQGTPEPSFSFGRVLESMLNHQFTNRHFEVINAAMRGIDSHVIRLIARDCARYQPDLFILYMGNNEAIGLHAPDPGSSRSIAPLSWLRFFQALKSTRLGQMLGFALERARPEHPDSNQDMDFWRKQRFRADDPRREAIYSYFAENLQDIFQEASQAGAKLLVSTVAVNLKDFPPLASLHRPGLAETPAPHATPATLEELWNSFYAQGIRAEAAGQPSQAISNFVAAAALDDHFAELHFRLARCYLAAAQPAKAQEGYQRARDWDALQFRTDRRLNEIIRQKAAGQSRVVLVDGAQLFAESPLSEHSVPGKQLFSDHVHFTFDGDYLLAKTFLPYVASSLGLSSLGSGPSSNTAAELAKGLSLPAREQCAEWLAFSGWDEVNVAAAMVKSQSKPPFLEQLEHDLRQARSEQELQNRLQQFGPQQVQQVLRFYQAALARAPEDWQLHRNLAGFYMDLRNYPAAIQEFQAALKLLPHSPTLMCELGDALQKAGRAEEALQTFQAVLRAYPHFPAARHPIANLGESPQPSATTASP